MDQKEPLLGRVVLWMVVQPVFHHIFVDYLLVSPQNQRLSNVKCVSLRQFMSQTPQQRNNGNKIDLMIWTNREIKCLSLVSGPHGNAK